MCEQNFVRFVDVNNGNFWEILHRPIAVGFFLVSIGTILFSVYNQRKINLREQQQNEQ